MKQWYQRRVRESPSFYRTMQARVPTLEEQITKKFSRAREKKELFYMETVAYEVTENNLPFVIKLKKVSENTPSKPQNISTKIIIDPFLPPYESGLHLSEWDSYRFPGKYAMLCNKFPVMNNHMLIVTTDFEHQFSPVHENHLCVLFDVVSEISGFGFYNAGSLAGPSQPHRHFQVLSCIDNNLPWLSLISMHAIKSDHSNIFQIPEFSFKHSAHFIPPTPSSRTLMHIYEKCLLSVDIPNVDDGVDGKFDPKRSHNLLMGMNWLMVVPR
eukprot:TRINITY_DN6071_c0_g1_i6.p1 TRINITY_DN6071_c0_g1~~TRINITY_DN6071_c0_g1_i6.p1  ORF type:complete len:270 (-),score=40.64 TRINITY_DN6071_c0_g1_i6:136-945(-)